MAQAKILVVDDDFDVADFLTQLLTYKGYAVTAVHSGTEALRRISEDRPDLVILDIMMPGMSGYEVCEAIKTDEATKNIPVIMLTARDMMEDVEKALKVKADWYIAKPYDNKYLFDKIAKLLRKKPE